MLTAAGPSRILRRIGGERRAVSGEPLSFCRSSLFAPAGQFDLGHVFNCLATEAVTPARIGELAPHHAGLFECDLADNSLIWSGGVYDLFGLERGSAISRDQILIHYCEDSRAKMERLRAHALRHLTGFTLDIELRLRAVAERRHVRLIAAPIAADGKAVRLHGVKLAL